MMRRSRLAIPILLVVVVLAAVGTSSAARVCLEDEFGAQYVLDANGGVVTGFATLEGEAVGALVGTRGRDGEFVVYGLNIAANCPMFGPISLTLVLDRTGQGLATGLASDCTGDTGSFCDDSFEGGEPLCDQPAVSVSTCGDRNPREGKGRHPLLSP